MPVREIDIVNDIGISRSQVYKNMSKLIELGYASRTDGYKLTKKGKIALDTIA